MSLVATWEMLLFQVLVTYASVCMYLTGRNVSLKVNAKVARPNWSKSELSVAAIQSECGPVVRALESCFGTVKHCALRVCQRQSTAVVTALFMEEDHQFLGRC